MTSISKETDGQNISSTQVKILRSLRVQQHARTWMSVLLLSADSISLLAAGLAGVGLRMKLYELVNPPFYWSLVPLIALFLGVYALQHLYPAVGLSPVEELRRLTLSTSAVFLFITAVTFWVRTAEYYSRLVYAFAWLFALGFVPVGRWVIRIIAVNLGLWGEPVAVIGCGSQAIRITEFLLNRMRLGLRPVAYIDFKDNGNGQSLTLPRYNFDQQPNLRETLHRAGIHSALLVSSETPPELQDAILNEQVLQFRRLILISNLNWVGSLGVTPHDLEGFLGLEVRQNLLNPWQQRFKRWLDIGLSTLFGLLAIPVTFIIALAIRIESPGRIFYRHPRIGRNGKEIVIWKFRTMVVNADQILSDYLVENPAANKEWKTNHKIKSDPRVTRVGRFLRKYSLDEIPQLWNVIAGEMSLVGPRPIVTDEIERYSQGYSLYKRVRPGITGLWQVSGRTDVGYDERVRFDEYYVRNWSIWLDIYILLRTVWAVLQRQGAY